MGPPPCELHSPLEHPLAGFYGHWVHFSTPSGSNSPFPSTKVPVGAQACAENLGAGARAGFVLCKELQHPEKVHPCLNPDLSHVLQVEPSLGEGDRAHKSTKGLELLEEHVVKKAQHKQFWGQDAGAGLGAGCPRRSPWPGVRMDTGLSWGWLKALPVPGVLDGVKP